MEDKNNNECVICLDNMSTIIFNDCKHNVICDECYIKSIIVKDNKINCLKECPVCRKEINHLRLNKAYCVYDLINRYFDNELSNDLYESIKIILVISANVKEVIQLIKQLHYEKYKSNKFTNMCMLNIQQTEDLLDIISKSKLIQDENYSELLYFLVSHCYNSWNVNITDPRVICYVCNFGEQPSFYRGIQIVLKNYNYIITEDS